MVYARLKRVRPRTVAMPAFEQHRSFNPVAAAQSPG
jgi:hypothetical protein